MGCPMTSPVSLLSRFPDVLLVEREEEGCGQVAQDISAVMEQALSDFDRMRSREGQKLSDDIPDPGGHH